MVESLPFHRLKRYQTALKTVQTVPSDTVSDIETLYFLQSGASTARLGSVVVGKRGRPSGLCYPRLRRGLQLLWRSADGSASGLRAGHRVVGLVRRLSGHVERLLYHRRLHVVRAGADVA